VGEHDALIEAIRRRDPDEAERIAREHMSRARQLRVSMIHQTESILPERPPLTSPNDQPSSLTSN
jgi:hypothetical protein